MVNIKDPTALRSPLSLPGVNAGVSRGDSDEAATTARLPVADVPNPKIGAALVVNSVTYRITRIAARTSYFTQVVLT